MKKYQHFGASIRRLLDRGKQIVCPWLHLGDKISILQLPTTPPGQPESYDINSTEPRDTANGPRRQRFKRSLRRGSSVLGNDYDPINITYPYQMMPSNSTPASNNPMHQFLYASDSLDLPTLFAQINQLRQTRNHHLVQLSKLDVEEGRLMSHLQSLIVEKTDPQQGQQPQVHSEALEETEAAQEQPIHQPHSGQPQQPDDNENDGY